MNKSQGTKRWQSSVTAIGLLLAYSDGTADMLQVEDLKPWEICAMCHGLNGTSAMAKFPNLSGQKPYYLIKQIQDFKSGYRNNDGGQMQNTVEALTDTQIRELAEYFSAQTPQQPQPTEKTPQWQQGKDLYRKNTTKQTSVQCTTCHNPKADNQIPVLQGQKKQYLIKQINDFKSGARTAVPVMQPMLMALDDKETEALALFLSTQSTPESLVIKKEEKSDF